MASVWVIPSKLLSSAYTGYTPVSLLESKVSGGSRAGYPDAPDPDLKWVKAYYERCAAYNTGGGLVGVYFPPAIDYVFDVGYENLVIFHNPIRFNITSDPTFPHWEEGHFFCARKEERREILFPYVPNCNGLQLKMVGLAFISIWGSN
jgi:hypothetical protein